MITLNQLRKYTEAVGKLTKKAEIGSADWQSFFARHHNLHGIFIKFLFW